MYESETSKVRHLVEPYLVHPVLDIGFGGDKISPKAYGSDLPQAYAECGTDTNDFPGNIAEGLDLDDCMFNTVYSSHLIEDFPNTHAIVKEHIRLTAPGGRVVLVFPDEQKYRETCKETGQPLNSHHQFDDMGMDFMKKVIEECGVDYNILFESDCEIDYNCVLVLEFPESA